MWLVQQPEASDLNTCESTFGYDKTGINIIKDRECQSLFVEKQAHISYALAAAVCVPGFNHPSILDFLWILTFIAILDFHSLLTSE